MNKTALIVIDPQVDFCSPKGALYVPGAENDMKRAGALVSNAGHRFTEIHVTLDTHHLMHIAHPLFWVGADGGNPEPFTLISRADVENGTWKPFSESLAGKAVNYVRQLEKNGRYSLVIWPPHCLIGSPGHSVCPELFEPLLNWEKTRKAVINYVTKGSNIYTEHYSAVQADVPDPEDASTELNLTFIKSMENSDHVLIAGEALNFCVFNTLRDIIAFFGKENIHKLAVLEDCMSPVPGFEQLTEAFYSLVKSSGVEIIKSTDI